MIAMAIRTSSIAHIRLTVTDIARSREFYESVFGWPVALEVPENADDATRAALGFLFGGVIYHIGDSLVGLRPVATDRFDEDRAGLDHLAFWVATGPNSTTPLSISMISASAHEPVKDIGPSYILEFRDPDNIALELTAPKSV